MQNVSIYPPRGKGVILVGGRRFERKRTMKLPNIFRPIYCQYSTCPVADCRRHRKNAESKEAEMAPINICEVYRRYRKKLYGGMKNQSKDS